MHADDLRKLLDLDGAAERSAGLIRSATARATSPHAIRGDDWTARKGRDLHATDASGVDAAAIADLYAASFLPNPELDETCGDPARVDFVRGLLESPEFQQSHADTRHDDYRSELAARTFAAELARYLADREQRERDRKPNRPSDSPLKSRRESSTPDPGAESRRAARAAREAAQKANEEQEELSGAMAAAGLGPGEPGSNDPARIAELHRRIRGDATLAEIMRRAGAFRRVAQSVRRRRTTHGADEVTGITIGSEIARLVPSELASLAIEGLDLDTLRRLSEGQALVREMRSSEPTGRGPVVFVVDESGSMQGDKINTAKALGLALAYVARQQRRWCALVAYTGADPSRWPSRIPGHRALVLKPGEWDELALCDWLAGCFGGGASRDVPATAELFRPILAEIGAPKGKSDWFFLTDALAHFDERETDGFNSLKREHRARLTTFLIDSPHAGDLGRISDETHCVPAFALTADHDAVGATIASL